MESQLADNHYYDNYAISRRMNPLPSCLKKQISQISPSLIGIVIEGTVESDP